MISWLGQNGADSNPLNCWPSPNLNQNIQEVKNPRQIYVRIFGIRCLYNKATNGPTDIKHEMGLSRMMMAWYIENKTNWLTFRPVGNVWFGDIRMRSVVCWNGDWQAPGGRNCGIFMLISKCRACFFMEVQIDALQLVGGNNVICYIMSV